MFIVNQADAVAFCSLTLLYYSIFVNRTSTLIGFCNLIYTKTESPAVLVDLGFSQGVAEVLWDVTHWVRRMVMVSTKRRELLTRLHCLNIPEDLNRMLLLQGMGELGQNGRF
jgi:hypothetical protein